VLINIMSLLLELVLCDARYAFICCAMYSFSNWYERAGSTEIALSNTPLQIDAYRFSEVAASACHLWRSLRSGRKCVPPLEVAHRRLGRSMCWKIKCPPATYGGSLAPLEVHARLR